MDLLLTLGDVSTAVMSHKMPDSTEKPNDRKLISICFVIGYFDNRLQLHTEDLRSKNRCTCFSYS